MSVSSIFILLAVVAAVAFSLYGLFNRRRSVFCFIGGIMVCLVAIPSIAHAWGEGQSIPWTVAYLAAGLVGGRAVFRQTKLPK